MAEARSQRIQQATHSGMHSCHKGRGGCRHVLPRGRQRLHALVVARQAVDATLNEDEAELRVLVLAVLVEMLADSNSLLDEVVQVFGQLRRQAVSLQDAEDL